MKKYFMEKEKGMRKGDTQETVDSVEDLKLEKWKIGRGNFP